MNRVRKSGKNIVAVSGGPDSVYLVHQVRKDPVPTLLCHYDHKARGKESEEDRKFVLRLSRELGLPLEIGTARKRGKVARTKSGDSTEWEAGFEKKAREERYRFFRETKCRCGAEKILVGQTADDQVETVLMRILTGAGISGLKGIPRSTKDGVERPLLDTWRKDILSYLKKHKIPYRVDRSNRDTRFERNWVRHVLIPLLEKRYGPSIRKRIFTLGERLREIDVYIEENALNWLIKQGIKQSAKGTNEKGSGQAIRIPRKAYAELPTILRVKILQVLCFDRIVTSPNERLLLAMDRLIVSGGPSGRLNIGKGATLRCRYGEAILSSAPGDTKSGGGKGPSGKAGKREEKKDRRGERKWKAGRVPAENTGERKGGTDQFLRMDGPGFYEWIDPGRGGEEIDAWAPVPIFWAEKGKVAPGDVRKAAEGSRQVCFDAKFLSLPLTVRKLRVGDRVRPFGLKTDKKVKEVLIDRKVPREERWGRPVVCDADGKIVWIPGVVRSADAPVTGRTRRTIVLRTDAGPGTSTRRRVTSEDIHAKLKGESRDGREDSYGV